MQKLFGSSGIRGVVNDFLTPELAGNIGSASASYFNAKKAVVGRDTRLSGLMIEQALISGLVSCGVDVKHLDIVPTPVLAYLTKILSADVGFMLTASHNPAQYNGIKIFDNNGLSVSYEQQKDIEARINEKKYILANWKKIGRTANLSSLSKYLEMVKKTIQIKKKWSLIIDHGCGATFDIGTKLFQNYGLDVTVLNGQPDGTFPGRRSEPDKESLKFLSQVAKTLKADIGIAFDGDGDRVAFITGNGKFVDFDIVLAAFAGYVLRKAGGGVLVTNVEASMCFEKIANDFNGKVVRTKVGDVYLSEAIKRHNAIFGGEPCGAWIHPQFHLCPDGPLSGVLLLKALEEENKTLEEFIAPIPRFTILRKNIFCSNDTKNKVIHLFNREIQKNFIDSIKISTIDGIRVSLDNGWILIRASGTEPLIRLTVEGESLKIAENILERGIKLIKGKIEE